MRRCERASSRDPKRDRPQVTWGPGSRQHNREKWRRLTVVVRRRRRQLSTERKHLFEAPPPKRREGEKEQLFACAVPCRDSFASKAIVRVKHNNIAQWQLIRTTLHNFSARLGRRATRLGQVDGADESLQAPLVCQSSSIVFAILLSCHVGKIWALVSSSSGVTQEDSQESELKRGPRERDRNQSWQVI